MSSGIRVLHVDDDALFRDLATRHLEREGLEVTTADSASAALDALEDDDGIDCVVSDYEMPATDGLELLSAVRERDPDLPFVLFTGKGSEEIASEAITAGVTDYLQKETASEQFALLANRIERAVTERRTEAALEESERMLSTLVSNLPGVVYRCRNDPGWPMEYVGGNVEEVTGYEAREFLAGDGSWGELIVEEDREAVWEAIQRALDAREPFEVTYRITRADGETRWLREQGQGVFESAEGDPVALEGFVTDVTDRKRRERELVEYDRLVDALGDPVYTTDEAGRITTFNDRAEELTGYDADEVLGEHVSKLLEQSDVERGEAVIRDLLGSDRKTATYDITVRTADGSSLDLENHVALLTHDGAFRGTIGVLRSSESRTDSRLHRLHNATRKLMAETDPERIAELTTGAAKEVIGLPIATVRFARGDDLELVAATEETYEAMGERPPFPVDETVAGEAYLDGEPRVEPDVAEIVDPMDPGEVRSAAYFPLGDHGVFVTAATDRDAFDESDIRLATILAANVEAALDRAGKEAALRRERDYLAALFENIPDPTVEVVVSDGEPIVERVNPAFERVFGYDNEAVTGENVDDFIVPDERLGDAREYNERIQEGTGFHEEVRRVAADGLRDFILHVVPHDVGEETARGYVIYTDITERKQRERKLQRQNERLDQFASVVSHDLRNPLSVARGRLDLARMTGEEEHFEAVDRAHNRMDELINGLLALARQGDLANDPVATDLGEAAEAAWETAETTDLDLTFDAPPTVQADPDRLRQLLENVFRNAAEHGGDAVTTVTVGALEDGFYVEDDGVGIPEGDRETVLQSGYSGVDGTGFGLAIVDTIAEAHGWRVTVAESAGGGARFEFREDSSLDPE